MSGNSKYIAILILFIGSVMGHVYIESEIQTIHVNGKHVENGHGRRGQTVKRFVLETDQGNMPILKFPIIGYFYGLDDLYEEIAPGQSIKVRVGKWPPQIVRDDSRHHILTIY